LSKKEERYYQRADWAVRIFKYLTQSGLTDSEAEFTAYGREYTWYLVKSFSDVYDRICREGMNGLHKRVGLEAYLK